MRSPWTIKRLILAWAAGLSLAALVGAGWTSAAWADAPPPSATPDAIDGVIQSVGLSPSPLGDNTDQLTLLPDGAAGPLTLTVDRPVDKQTLALGARAGDQIWLTVDDPIKPQHVVQITRLARPVPPAQRLLTLGATFLVIAGLATLATARRPWRFLVGDDNRLSNSQCQLVLWFGVVAVVYGATLILRAWFLGWDFMGGIAMTTNVLAMTGLSGLAFGAAKVVAVQKDASAAAAVAPPPADPTVPAPPPATPGSRPPLPPRDQVRPRFTDLVLNDYGEADLGDFQMILISTAAALIFACASWQYLGLIDIAQATTLPDIDTALLGGFGVGQGAYLIKKAALPAGVG